ncbi:MAG: alpha/beta fold hydrolase [Bryobacterales bacterium]|nr:alpha/beta fold hydrolase [Bryobacterales bacterium]
MSTAVPILSPPPRVPVPPFDPLFRNGHLATLSTVAVRPFLDEARFPPTSELFESEPGVRVRVVSQQPAVSPRGHLVLVHGLEGNSDGSYMRSLAQRALAAGFGAHRMNMRNCGGTEAHCPALYHAGLVADILAWTKHLRARDGLPIFLAGFSLGGNQVSKLAGELGCDARSLLAGVCAVSTPIDLAVCSRCIQSPSNWLYQKQFVLRMKATLRRKHALFPHLFSLEAVERIRTIWDLDDRYVAPLGGFRDAAHYYGTQSAQNFLGDVRIPMLLVHAADDPFIPIDLFQQPAVQQNEWIQFVRVPHGGHMGFLARRTPKFWLNELVLNWMECLVPSVFSTLQFPHPVVSETR